MSPDEHARLPQIHKRDRPVSHDYFVDASGDRTFFDGAGKVIVGREGVSHTFIVGAAFSEQWAPLCERVEALRHALLADPYFRHVPSMQPSAG